MSESLFDKFRDAPFKSWNDNQFTDDHGALRSLDGVKASPFAIGDVAEVLYHGRTDDDWDGNEAAVVRLTDGRLVAWETWWGPTGSGFSEDAYGGDAELWFAGAENLSRLILMALTDQGRELCGIPREGLAS